MLTRLDHPKVKRWVALRKENRARKEEGALLLSSPREIEEVFERSPLRTLIVTEDFSIPAKWQSIRREVVSQRLLEKITGLKAPQGCAAEIDLPGPATDLEGWTLILDGIAGPGNLGTLLRTGLALGWESVWVLPGTADLWNEKVLRASKGATFKLAYREGSVAEVEEWAQRKSMPLWIADLNGADVRKQPSPCGLILGNEAHGPAPCWSRGTRITISHHGEMESLNVAVAGGILMAAMRGVI
jgi:RNA methyltransferase, TrmH family